MTFHHFTVDVEEFFHSTLLTSRLPQPRWDEFPRRSPEIVDWLLRSMEEAGAKGTFFVLGWLAEREPAVVRAIADANHEIASHGYDHVRIPDQTPDAFRASVRRSKQMLEDLTGREVIGFRAPSFSILPGYEWALDVLLEEGYRYDSSLFPISVHPSYGFPGAPRDPHWIERPSGRLLEVPPLTLSVLGRRLPAAGGAYLRLLPYRLISAALRQAERREVAGTTYIHPWDLDPVRPSVRLPPLLSLRLFGGAVGARSRVQRLLRDFRSVPIQERLGVQLRGGTAPG
jgi:polysaccharide deacetylase family protein (PEP-CTERM system associated)